MAADLTDKCSKNGSETGQGDVIVAENAETHGSASNGHSSIVQPKSVDFRLVGQVAEDNPADDIGDSDDGQEKGRICFVLPQLFGSIGQENVGHLESETGEEIGDGKPDEDPISQKRRVHHFEKNAGNLRSPGAFVDDGTISLIGVNGGRFSTSTDSYGKKTNSIFLKINSRINSKNFEKKFSFS
jgi:hypothetical protein